MSNAPLFFNQAFESNYIVLELSICLVSPIYFCTLFLRTNSAEFSFMIVIKKEVLLKNIWVSNYMWKYI